MDAAELSGLCTPWCIHVVATLRIAEHIAAGVTGISELAEASGADPDSLSRVLRYLVSEGVFDQPERGRFALNAAARPLLDEGLRLGLDLDGIGGRMAYAWGTLLSAVRSGKPAYHEVFGRPFWEDLDAHPAISESFDALMGPAGHGAPDPAILANDAEWPDIRTVVDVGGGAGALLAEVLCAHPHLRGVLVDLPRTVARSHAVFEEAGVADRVTAVAQSFFDPLPAGYDLYVMKSVLSDWPDPEAVAILTRCAEAARPAGRVVVFTGASDEEDASPELLMMVLVGGRDRTLAQFRELARQAGLNVTAVARQPSGRSFVECRPV